jgi:hypothetical protein
MAQTTGGFNVRNCKVEISVNGSVWADISGQAAGLESPEQVRLADFQHTLDGDAAIVLPGKLDPSEVTCKFVHSESATEAADILRTAFENNGTGVIYFRYTPKGSTTGNYIYTASSDAGAALPCPVSSFVYPGASEANDAKPILGSFKILVPCFTKSAVA